MKKVKVTITQEFELPDEYSVIEGPGGKLIKCGETYLSPQLEFMQSNKFSEESMNFEELNEDMRDLIYETLISEIEDVSEI